MKRLSSILVILMLCAMLGVSLAGCGDNATNQEGEDTGSSIEGTTWALVGGTQDGVEVSLEDLMGGIIPTYEFKADGVVTNSAGENSMDGTYTENGNIVSISLGGNTFDLTIDGDTMTMEQDNMVMYFELQ